LDVEIFPRLLNGTVLTVKIAVLAMFFATVLSIGLGLARLIRPWPIRWLVRCYVEFFRGTSLLVQLFWLYFALPIAGDAIGIDLRLPPVAAGVLALGLNIGAYGAEVVRGAIQSVRYSQYEAAKALNFSPRQALWRIALPQAIPEMMPAFGNLAVQNLKDTALASLISLGDLAFVAERIRNFTQDSTTIYTMILFMYFGMALVVAGFMRLIERAVGRWRRVGH
jgi:polar amino acid transport system permease protein